MNSMSLGDDGGKTPVVEAGRTFVSWPGAPGWTITGTEGLACCAKLGADIKQANSTANTSGME